MHHHGAGRFRYDAYVYGFNVYCCCAFDSDQAALRIRLKRRALSALTLCVLMIPTASRSVGCAEGGCGIVNAGSECGGRGDGGGGEGVNGVDGADGAGDGDGSGGGGVGIVMIIR